MAKRNTSSRNRGDALPLDQWELIEQYYEQRGKEKQLQERLDKHPLQQLRQRLEQIRQTHAERKAMMDKCERYLRCWQTPPKTLLDKWVKGCEAEQVDPVNRHEDLRRPLKHRLKELIGSRPEGWNDGLTRPKDRDLYGFYCWDVFDDRERIVPAAELVTYLEDVQEELWRRQERRSMRRVAEWERAEVVVVALLAVLKEFRLYFAELTGDQPKSDPRLRAVLTPLLDAGKKLKRSQKSPRPRSEPERRPTVGSKKNWATEVQREVLRRLNEIRPWRKYEDDSEMEHARMLRRLSEKIVERLGMRVSRGIGSTKAQRPRPQSNPQHVIARRICTALGVQRLGHPRNRR